MTVAMNCLQCGVPFTTTNQQAKSGRKFCSAACYRAREMANGPRKLVEPVKFTCKHCGAPFERDPGELRSYHAKHGKDPMYCSTKCGGIGRRTAQVKICKNCGGPILRKDTGRGRTRTVCSQDCRRALKKTQMLEYFKDHVSEPRPAKHGYMRLTIRRNANERAVEVLQHRYVMEQHIGRPLRPDETVHHINGVRSDNRLENLELFSSQHGPGQRVIDKVEFIIEIAKLYPEFLREAGYELTPIAKPSNRVAEGFLEELFDAADHPPSVS